MKRFIYLSCVFLSIIVAFFVLGLLIPATPKASKSLLFSAIEKEQLLKSTTSPRLILIGGSNLSFGINSQMLKDSLQMNPINTGIHASIGLIYMLNNLTSFVQKGDLIILAAEYEQFYGELAFGENQLLRTVFDVNPRKLTTLEFTQLIHLLKYIPKYSLSKLNPYEYHNTNSSSRNLYSRTSFNKFGDVTKHWNMKSNKCLPHTLSNQKYNDYSIAKILEFNNEIKKKEAKLLISFCGFQKSSFENCNKEIQFIEKRLLLNSNLNIISNPSDYIIPDSLIFDSPYHFTKKGADLRTFQLIKDVKRYLK